MYRIYTHIACITLTFLAVTALHKTASAQLFFDFEQESTGTVLATLELSSLPASHMEVEGLTFTPAGDALFGLGLSYDGVFDSSFDRVVLDGAGGLMAELEGVAFIDDNFPVESSTVIGPLQLFALTFYETDYDTVFLHNVDDTALVFIEGDWVSSSGGGTSSSGDFDGDGDRDGVDFLEWQRQFGLTGITPFSGADATGDGNVDGADFTTWKSGYGLVSSTLVATTVPEPSTLLLSMFFLLRLRIRRSYS